MIRKTHRIAIQRIAQHEHIKDRQNPAMPATGHQWPQHITDCDTNGERQADAKSARQCPRHDRQPHATGVRKQDEQRTAKYSQQVGRGWSWEHSCGRTNSSASVTSSRSARGPKRVETALPRCRSSRACAPSALSSYTARRGGLHPDCCDLVGAQQRGRPGGRAPPPKSAAKAGRWQGFSDTSSALLSG